MTKKTIQQILDEQKQISKIYEISEANINRRVALSGIERSSKDIDKIKKSLEGHHVSDSTKKAISSGLLGKTKGKQKTKHVTCPHCGLTGATSSMMRFHFDKCESINSVIGTNIKTKQTIRLSGNTQIKNAGFSYGNIIGCINGTRKSHKGYTWSRE